MRCPGCRTKPGRPHRAGCEFGIPISYDPSPKVPPPVDPVQAHLAQIEEWAGTVNQRLAALEAPAAYPDGAPPGVVSPHVRANLEALTAWTDPYRWKTTSPSGVEQLLTRIHAQVQVALAGGDVIFPPGPLAPPNDGPAS